MMINEQDIVVKEMTVADIRNWLEMLKTLSDTTKVDAIGDGFFPSFTMRELEMFCNLSTETSGQLTPTQVTGLIERIKAANPLWVDYRRRLFEAVATA